MKYRVAIEREYYGRAVVVKLEPKSWWRRNFTFTNEELTVATVILAGDDFDEKLAETIADARQRAITLNGGIDAAGRRLPS